ncbi:MULTISPECIES: DoxX family protein [Sphingobacterium]|uniref:DoxX family membrane protein n=1 Tax=Sphingobacterium populi TaxID=1812824 RepID=A0ABW5UEK6_9SPHI|nr:hypothetical protein [Sphingobacterium sp. CFCC 11742]
MKQIVETRKNIGRHIARVALGAFFVFAGVAHLTFGRRAFRAQVPNWVPATKDQTVVWSGYLEIMLGLLTLMRSKPDPRLGYTIGVFLIAVFPGNWAQYKNQRNAFGLNTDRARFVRLLFQPLLIWLALYSMGAMTTKKFRKLTH